MIKNLIGLVIISLIMTGCYNNGPMSSANTSISKKQSLSDTIIDIANQLKHNKKLDTKYNGTIALTTFVNLEQLDKTTPFGRILSESMFNELFVRGFNVAEFRGQNSISVNAKGEFYITRDATKLKEEIANTYILVGTYSELNDSNIVINVRIIDNQTGKVITTARSVFNCNYCIIDKNTYKRKIKIVSN